MRLTRVGSKKNPVYRVVVADSRSPRDGKFIEIIGQYAPRQKGGEGGLKVDEERANYWLGVGAQPSDTVRSLLRRAGVRLETLEEGLQRDALLGQAAEHERASALPRHEEREDRRADEQRKL